MNFLSFLGLKLDAIGKIIDELHTSKEEKMRLKNELMASFFSIQKKVLEYEKDIAEIQYKTLQQEMNSKSVLARIWRPILMLGITFIILWNHTAAPLFSMPYLPLSPELMSFIKLGVTGYIVGRSGEKIANNIITQRITGEK